MANVKPALRPLGIGFLFATGLVAFVAGACGGGGDDGAQGGGTRITDPAKVASSTPIQNPLLYQIKGDTVSTSGGATATVQARSSNRCASPRRSVAWRTSVADGT